MRVLAVCLAFYFTIIHHVDAATYWVRLKNSFSTLVKADDGANPDDLNGPNEPIIFMKQILPNVFFDVPGTIDGNDGYIAYGASFPSTTEAEWAILHTAVDDYFLVGSKPDPNPLIGG